MTGRPEPEVSVSFLLDGEPHKASVWPRTSLADHLRDSGAGLNVGCDQGTCGSCLLRLDRQLVRSCLTLAVQADGGEVETVRALAPGGDPGPVQRAMSRHGALQCGFCSPAFALAITELAGQARPAGPMRTSLSAVTCRCTGYAGLAAAAADRIQGAPEPDQPLSRREDARLLTGHGRFVGSATVPGCLWAAVVRAGQAPAHITAIDVTAARDMPGVVAIYTAQDLPAAARLLPSGDCPATEPVLAQDAVGYIGQPLALVVAEDAYLAQDAAEAVRVGYAAVTEPGPSLEFREAQRVGDPAALDAPGAVTIAAAFRVGRHTGMPLEPRGLIAEPDGQGGLIIRGYTKKPRVNRDLLCSLLSLPTDRVRAVPADVGGAFGVKGEFYPEDLLIPLAALRLERPVRWLEDRCEHMVATNHSREQEWSVRLAARPDGTLLGAEVGVVSDIGAYRRPLTALVPYLATAMFPGPYRMPAFLARIAERVSAKTPIGTYRAPGRFEANFVRERALDLLAARLGLTGAELRRRNLLSPAELPHDTGTLNEGPVVYDEADFPAAFEQVTALLDRDDGPVPDGLRRGTAVIPFVEKASLGPSETAAVTVHPDGSVRVDVDSAPSGQGHETVFARIAARALGTAEPAVTVRCGDTSGAGRGLGTFASRGATMTGNAVLAAAHRAAAADPAPDRTRRATASFTFDGHTYPYGAVGAVVDVDPETFTVTVRRLVIACDAGRVLDERVVRGQLIGGAVQGIGGALLEELPYAGSEPLARGLADYLLPLAADVPDIEVLLIGGDAAATPLGVRGVGEAGIAPMGAVLACAVADALPEASGALTELPLTPGRLHAAWRSGLVPGTVGPTMGGTR